MKRLANILSLVAFVAFVMAIDILGVMLDEYLGQWLPCYLAALISVGLFLCVAVGSIIVFVKFGVYQ